MISVCWSAAHIESLRPLWCLFQVDLCKKLVQAATKYLETGTNLMHGIEACSEVLESVGLDIDDYMKHDCLCTRAGLYLQVCLLLL
jgi:WD and tetratricopeptide repeats protein 1